MSDPKPTAGPPARAKPTWWDWTRRVSLVLAGILGLGVVFGAWKGYQLLNVLGGGPKVRFDEGILAGGVPDEPRNILVLGSDSRAGLTAEEKEKFGSEKDVPDDRTDTIILMHLDPTREQAVIVHFPRDLRVPIPDHGVDKINAAYQYGGPELAVETVKQFTGLPIHNYIEVSLAGFQDLVDSLGGVTICVDQPMYDELAGLDIPTAGCHLLDGFMALAFVRARHIEGDAIPDFSRIARQQQFMRALVNKMLSLGSLIDDDLIRDAVQQVKTDERLTGAELVYLAAELRKVAVTDPSGGSLVDFRAVPSTPEFIDGVAYVIADQPESRQLFQRLANGQPLGDLGKVLLLTDVSPAQITAQVLQAASPELALQATELLRQSGFVVLDPRDAPASLTRSQILFGPDGAPMAEVVGDYFPELPVSEGQPRLLGDADVILVAGRDYASIQP